MSGATRLYTPELLAQAVSLADHPWNEALPHRGTARSPSCGSTISLALSTDTSGRIADMGVRAQACAVGQAAAAIFAQHATGHDYTAIHLAHDEVLAWLAGDGPLPAWPGLAMLQPARAYPARHGAIMLPWKAAVHALSNAPRQG